MRKYPGKTCWTFAGDKRDEFAKWHLKGSFLGILEYNYELRITSKKE